jgi:endonuclease III
MVDASEILEVLQEHYSDQELTTLNGMREKPDPFKVLIGCLVSINIKDDVTNIILEELFDQVKGFQDILDISTRKLEKILWNSRYRKVKAARLKDVSRDVLDRFKGEVPSNEDDLLSIKGIGPKTCNLVLNFAFGQNKIPVDSNTIRISNRIGWIDSKKADDVESLLVEELDEDFLKEANAVFMLHGKNICVSVSPHCSRCPVNGVCKRVGVKRSR